MACIEKLRIKNYKCFEDFEIIFNDNLNIIVGNNEEGKSTILEAIHLVITGLLNGKPLYTDFSASLFNLTATKKYIESLSSSQIQPPPMILIEAYLKGDGLALFEGDGNLHKTKNIGIALKISFDDKFQDEYQELIEQGEIKTIPIEYYKIERYSFARAAITNKSIPLTTAIIDSSSPKYQNGSDIYISKIIKDSLETNELVALAQSYRKLKENFGDDSVIQSINSKLSIGSDISNRQVRISVDTSMKSSWETILMTFIDDIPFHQIGKGEQCFIKTNLALANQKTQSSNIILIEEPENHLSHTKLNQLLDRIIKKCTGKQLIITTHSNFVANKLDLSNLILLSSKRVIRFNDLQKEDTQYFQKLPGFDTLRLILAKSTLLVEGPSDELIVQRAYLDKYGCLPIQGGIDVISVRGLSFKRFLEIAKRLKTKVAVITDNDGDFEHKISQKYKEYDSIESINICADNRDHLKTLEPQFVDANNENLSTLRSILDINYEDYPTEGDIVKYMTNNKSDWALKVFESQSTLSYPDYITNAIEWIHEGE